MTFLWLINYFYKSIYYSSWYIINFQQIKTFYREVTNLDLLIRIARSRTWISYSWLLFLSHHHVLSLIKKKTMKLVEEAENKYVLLAVWIMKLTVLCCWELVSINRNHCLNDDSPEKINHKDHDFSSAR